MKNRQLIYAIVSADVLADSMTSRLSHLHVAHNIWVKKIPTTIPMLVVSAAWRANEYDVDSFEVGKVDLRVISPGGEPINEFHRELDQNNKWEDIAIFKVTNIPILGEGDLWFELSLDGEIQRKYPVRIIKSDKNYPE